tara:strand:+ start:1707 stop:2231 length:525 start_codon:yes stop_codon:yes gene_type:complete
MIDFKDHTEEQEGTADELQCPQCRQVIVEEFENYDLQHITNNVDTNTLPYWSRRLIEAVHPRGTVVEIDDKLLPFCKTLFTRIVYKDDLNTLGHIKSDKWTVCDRQKVDSITKAFINALTYSKIEVDEAIDWITVLNVPHRVEVRILHDVHKYFTTKKFLQRVGGEWLMDTLFD